MPAEFDSNHPNLLIVGAGPTGCVIAERAAAEMNWRSVVIDRCSHIGGLCHECHHESGVFIHAFGPHCFRTDSKRLLDYLSKFTGWIPGNYIVRSKIGDILCPISINLTTLEMFFGKKLNAAAAGRLLESVRENHPKPRNAEQWVCNRVGRAMYEAFCLGDTQKQWDRHPSELDPSICGRIPIRLNRDERYVHEKFQVVSRRNMLRGGSWGGPDTTRIPK